MKKATWCLLSLTVLALLGACVLEAGAVPPLPTARTRNQDCHPCAPALGTWGYYSTQWQEWPCERRPDKVFPQSINREILPTPPGVEAIPPVRLPPEVPRDSTDRPGTGVTPPGGLPTEGGMPGLGTGADRPRSPSGFEGLGPAGAEPMIRSTTPLPSFDGPSSPPPRPRLEPPSGDRGRREPEPLIPRTPGRTPEQPAEPSGMIIPPAPLREIPVEPGLTYPAASRPVVQQPLGWHAPREELAEPRVQPFPPEPPRPASRERSFDTTPSAQSALGPAALPPAPSANDSAARQPAIAPVKDRFELAIGRRLEREASPPATKPAVPSAPGVATAAGAHWAPPGYATAVQPVAADTPADLPANAGRASVYEESVAAPVKPAATGIATDAQPSVALEGYCPVELAKNERWVNGDRRWTVVHQGRTYQLASPIERECFLVDPDRYVPAFNGNDAVLAVDQKSEVPGTVDQCVNYAGRVYLFSSSATANQFRQNPRRYAQ